MEQQLTPLVLFALFTVLALSCVGGYMGIRIYRNALSGGGTAEKWVGLALMLVCGGGYIPIVIAQLLGQPEVRFLLTALGIGAAHVGVSCIFVFTRLVFRPDVAWLRFVVASGIAALNCVWPLGLVMINWPLRADPEQAIVAGLPFAIASNAFVGTGMAWSAIEAIRAWSVSRKRARIGLSDPLVANRMLLWGVFTGGSFITSLVGVVDGLLGFDPAQHPPSLALVSAISLASTVALWLAFLPPQAWIRRIRGASAAS
jgi:hypothetical protein